MSILGDAANIVTAPTGAVADAALNLVGKADDALNKDPAARLSTVLARNGWGAPKSDLNARARAVVKRESRGKSDAYNEVHCGQDCKGPFSQGNAVGLFQICDKCHAGKLGSPRDKSGFREWASDPDNNARLARSIQRSAGWRPWSASGGIPAPDQAFDPVIVTDKDSLIGGTAEAVGKAASPFAAVGSAAVDLIGTLMSADTWFRIGKGGLGFVLIVTGTGALVYVVANQATGGAARRAIRAAAK